MGILLRTKKKIFWCGIFPIIASFLRKGRTRLVREPRIDLLNLFPFNPTIFLNKKFTRPNLFILATLLFFFSFIGSLVKPYTIHVPNI